MNLSDAVDQYLVSRQARGIKPQSVRSEEYVLRQLLLAAGNINTRHLSHRHLDAFWTKRGAGWAESTRNKARAHLASFFKWCKLRGYLPTDTDLLGDTKALRVPERSRLIIPQAEFSTFLEGIGDARTRAMCAIGLYLFTRISETSLLRWQDVLFSENRVLVTREKTGTADSLPMCEELAKELKRWHLTYSAMIGRQLTPADFVIPFMDKPRMAGVPGHSGKLVRVGGPVFHPSQRAQLTTPIKLALKNAGYYQRYEGGHTLRRSGATALYHELASRGHDKAMRLCQWMLGHKTITTTEIYLRLSLEEKEAQDLLSGQPMFKAMEGQVVHLKSVMADE